MGDKGIVNPHNPEFITKKPWYLANDDDDANQAALDHQQVHTETKHLTLTAAEELLAEQRRKEEDIISNSHQSFEKGQWVEALKKNKKPYRICQIVKVTKSSATTVSYDLQYEDGSLEKRVKNIDTNRPRIRATRAGNRSSKNQTLQDTYDSKRDQYHGFDRDTHNTILKEKFEEKLALRRKLRDEGVKEDEEGEDGANAEKRQANGPDSDFDDSDVESGGEGGSDDEFVQRDQDAKVMTTRLARQGGVGGAQMKVTARNLRIREDTAKYLRNLDTSSAYYDPKSRSMRDNPNPDATDSDFVGDNLTRITGDAVGLAQQQLFAWEATARGVQEVHPQANPSQAELLKKTFQTQAKDLQEKRKRAVLDKYGGEEYLDTNDASEDPSSRLRFGVSTNTEEYNRDGKAGRGTSKRPKQKAIPCKYEEDIFINGHTSVFGSYFHIGAFTWGYADDHSLMKQSYCTGAKGRIANDEANERQFGTGKAGTAALAQARTLVAKPAAARSKDVVTSRSKLFGEANQDAQLDADKVKDAAAKLSEDDKRSGKRKYNSMDEVEMTEEMMEAYRLQRGQKNDPMAKLGSDQLLEYK